MRYIIDTDLMAANLSKVNKTKIAEFVLQVLRNLHGGQISVNWITPEKKSKACPRAYSVAFEKFWKDYPKKTGKGGAWKAWWKAKGLFAGQEETLILKCKEALMWQKNCDQWVKDEGQYIPLAATWLNQSRWEDEDPNAGSILEEYLSESGDVKTRRRNDDN